MSGLRASKKTAAPEGNKKAPQKIDILTVFVTLSVFLAIVLLFENLFAEFCDFGDENLAARGCIQRG